jgi:hypothetical protein
MWRKKELELYANPITGLAEAVIKQWNLDGRPKGDADGVKVWADLLTMYAAAMHGGVAHGEVARKGGTTSVKSGRINKNGR